MSDFENEVFDWDSEIESDGQEYVAVVPGDYSFTVTKVERKQYQGSDKIPACNMAEVSGTIDVPKGTATFRERLYLVGSQEWKLSSFFRCLGMKKHGEALKMDWNGSIGESGRATITKTKGEKQDIFFNNVKAYLDPVKAVDDEWS